MRGFIYRMAAVLTAVVILANPISTKAMTKEEAQIWTESLPEEGWPKAPEISSQAALVADVETGALIYAKNATNRMYPASTTKLMTALLALENLDLDEVIPYSWKAVNTIGQNASHIGMRTGEQLNVRDSLYGLLLPSANEVANALAERMDGSVEEFAERMNERAAELGAVNTHFANANGLHDDTHYSCAYDLYLIMRACIERKDFMEIDSKAAYYREADEVLDKNIPMGTTNMLIKKNSEFYNDAVICGKTGHTEQAGRVLVTYSEKNDMKVICVVMGGTADTDHFTDTNLLLNYTFQNFRKTQISEGDGQFAQESLQYSTPLEISRIPFQLVEFQASSLSVLPNEVRAEDLDRTIVAEDGKTYMEYRLNGYLVGKVRLVEGRDRNRADIFETEGYYISEMTDSDGTIQVVYVTAIAMIVIMVVVVILLAILNIRQKNPRNAPRHRAKKMKFDKRKQW